MSVFEEIVEYQLNYERLISDRAEKASPIAGQVKSVHALGGASAVRKRSTSLGEKGLEK